jgi:hypothetical protein
MTTSSSVDSQLQSELDRWVAAAVITTDQAEAIRRIEAERAAQVSTAGRIPLVAQALGFLGGALAAIAGIVATSRFWDHFATGTRLGVVAVVAALLVAAGALVRRGDEPALENLGSFLWLVATGAAAFWGGLLGNDVLHWRGPDVAVAIGVVALTVGVVLWLWRPAPLQHLATFAALAITVGGVAGQVEHVGGVDVGITLWALGLTWAVLGWNDVVGPAPLAYALGSAVAMGGVMAVAGESSWGDALAIATALALLGASVPARSIVLVWTGVVGVFMSVPGTIFEHLGDSASVPLALFLAGAALIGVAIVASRLAREVRAAPAETKRIPRQRITLALLAGVVAVTGATVGITQVQLRAIPQFPSLRSAPDATLPGTVAFFRRSGDRPCLYVVAASGAAAERRLRCNGDFGDDVAWNDAGNIVVVQFGRDTRAVEVNPQTGAVVSRSAVEDLPLFKEKGLVLGSGETRASDGAVLEVDNRSNGRARVRVRTSSGTAQVVFSTQGPRDYHFWRAVWSGDGRHGLVTDSEGRLLVIGVDEARSKARVLVGDASGAACSR